MVGCGLRRAEVCALEWTDIVERGGRVVVELVGKGERRRTIPMPEWVRGYVEEWRMECGT
jgi:integrase